MRSDIRESFENLQRKQNDKSLTEKEKLYFRQLLSGYVDAWCFASDKIKSTMKYLEEEAKEYALLRDLVEKMKVEK